MRTGWAAWVLGMMAVIRVAVADRASAPRTPTASSPGIARPDRCSPAICMATRTRISPEATVSRVVAVIRAAKQPQVGSGAACHRRSTPSSLAMTRALAWVKNAMATALKETRPATFGAASAMVMCCWAFPRSSASSAPGSSRPAMSARGVRRIMVS
jgi:hypothetical protein